MFLLSGGVVFLGGCWQISKTHKMKTMSKKQLRQIKKRQVNSRTGEIEFVSPWGGGKKKSK